ncbi:hypothetical protein AXJ18_gp127 [Streptomyces phage Jay2Jay]|uniref:Uncharacterized protein n=1 Tax=Streptomyces phage Jay2Jay TaxID=1556290 RepID=A0A0A0RQM7_9CAUD|nr:hypothetical protein AXJ18_gp127 [Streptomyces phage Jay2Jay]AIW02647.1 hypothetical protein PBI_JAY2JAY_188 [Streptomyces phage Jay2Jay]
MPKWMRLESTRDAPFSDRFWSAFENGYGDEGPLAKASLIGCMFGCLGVCLAIIGVPLAFLLMWIF